MIYGIYKATICGFDTDGRFIGNFDEIPTKAIVYSMFADSDFNGDYTPLEYLYWAIEKTHYRNLEKSVMRGIHSEHAFTRQFRIFMERWGRCSMDGDLLKEAVRRSDMFSKAQRILNSTSLRFDDVEYPNKYLYGTVSGRFTNVSGKRNLLAISKADKARVRSSYGRFVHLDMKAFHFNILKRVYSIDVPERPYDYIVDKLGVSRDEAKTMCLRWMNSDEFSSSAPNFIRSIWSLRDSRGMTAKEFNYEIQTEENRLMCEIITRLDSLLTRLGLNFSICNYCYDSITIDCDYRASEVIRSLLTEEKYYAKVLGGFPFTFDIKEDFF